MKLKVTLSALTAALIALIILTTMSTLSALPSVIQYSYDLKSGGDKFSVERMIEIDERIEEINVGSSTLSFIADGGEYDVRGHRLSLCLINKMYLENYKIACESFTDDSVIISKKLALELFYSENPAGKPLTINGRTYKVSAVCDDISDDGRERVFVSYESVKNGNKAAVTEFAAKSGSISAIGLEQMKLTNYYPINLAQKRKVIGDFPQLLKLILFFFLCLACLKIRRLILTREKAKIDDSMTVSYRLRSIVKNPREYGFYILAFAGFPAALVAVFILMNAGVYIIPEYIPLDNIFDIPYYIEQMNKAAQSLNQTALIGNLSYLRLYQSAFTALCCETTALAVSSALTYLAWTNKRNQ